MLVSEDLKEGRGERKRGKRERGGVNGRRRRAWKKERDGRDEKEGTREGLVVGGKRWRGREGGNEGGVRGGRKEMEGTRRREPREGLGVGGKRWRGREGGNRGRG